MKSSDSDFSAILPIFPLIPTVWIKDSVYTNNYIINL